MITEYPNDNSGWVIDAEKDCTLEWRNCGHGVYEITDINVNSEMRRTGVGSLMVKHLIDSLKANDPDCQTLFAVTRSTNRIAQEFYESLRFKVLGILRNFYSHDAKAADAIVYGRHLKGEA